MTKNLSLEKFSEVNTKYEEISSNVKEFNKGKEKLHDLLTFQSNDRNKFGLDFDEKSVKKASTKSKLEDVFVKKQHSFKVSNDSKKDSVFNKSSSTNISTHTLNDRNSYSRRSNDRFSNRSFSTSRNFHKKNLRSLNCTTYTRNASYNESNRLQQDHAHTR